MAGHSTVSFYRDHDKEAYGALLVIQLFIIHIQAPKIGFEHREPSHLPCSDEPRYQLLQDLGQGTFSTVKLATTSQGSTHAIKCFARRVTRWQISNTPQMEVVPLSQSLNPARHLRKHQLPLHIFVSKGCSDCTPS